MQLLFFLAVIHQLARTTEMTDGIGKAFTKRLVEDFGPFLGYRSLAQQG